MNWGIGGGAVALRALRTFVARLVDYIISVWSLLYVPPPNPHLNAAPLVRSRSLTSLQMLSRLATTLPRAPSAIRSFSTLLHPPVTSFSSDENQVRDMVAQWAAAELSPHVREMDRACEMKPEILQVRSAALD